MITGCEQNYAITPCDWCLDISQITTLHKPQMIHKKSMATGRATLYEGDRQQAV